MPLQTRTGQSRAKWKLEFRTHPTLHEARGHPWLGAHSQRKTFAIREHRIILQRTATRGNTLIRTTPVIRAHCNTLQHMATYGNTAQRQTFVNRACWSRQVLRIASRAHCNTLQHISTHCNTWQRQELVIRANCNTLQHISIHRNTLHRKTPVSRAHCHTPRRQTLVSRARWPRQVFRILRAWQTCHCQRVSNRTSRISVGVLHNFRQSCYKHRFGQACLRFHMLMTRAKFMSDVRSPDERSMCQGMWNEKSEYRK